MQDMYHKQNISKEWLIANGFRYSRNLSDEETHIYTYRFPVFKYEKMTILECELNVSLEDGEMKINVYDYGINDKYAPFYYCEYGNHDDMLKEINEKIESELIKLKIYREAYNSGSKNKKTKK